MKKRILSLTLIMAMIFTQISFISVFAETTTDASTQTPIESAFTDANFLNAVRTVIGKTNGEPIYPSDVENITSLNVERKRIVSLAGIEYFTGLKELIVAANKIGEADFSKNEQLEIIDCSYNTTLKTLDVSNNPKLQTLECNYGKLSRLDITNNPELKRLLCFSNSLHTLDISHNPLLEELDAKSMGLTLIDMRNNPNLKKVNITQNYISQDRILLPEGITLDSGIINYASQKTSDISKTFTDPKLLESVRESINKPTGSIYQSDVDKITELDVEQKQLTSLDGIEHLKSLETLNCASNFLTDLDVSSNLELQDVKCYRNDITSLDFTNNNELREVNAYWNKLEDINISENALLENVDVSQNLLSSIDISSSNNLDTVNISKNNIVSDKYIKLSDKYDSNLMEQAKATGYKTVPTNAAKVKVYPQYTRYLDAIIIDQDGSELKVNIFTAPRATLKVFDVTDCDGIKEYEEGDMPFEDESDNLVFENNINDLKEGSIEQTINVSPISEDPEEPEYEGTVTLTGNRTEYKLLVVAYIEDEESETPAEPRAIAAQVIKAIPDIPPDPKVIEFKINNGLNVSNSFGDFAYGQNGKGEVFDVLATSKPTIVFFGYKFYVYVALENYEDVEKVIVRMSRNDHNPTIEKQYIELTSNGGGIFAGYGFIPESYEGSVTWGREGKIYLSWTDKNDLEKDLATYDVGIVIDPSGYIYEGVPSNRLRDVKTTIYYEGRNGEAVKWNAAEENQKNPIFTNSRGMFEWAVPAGRWQVKAEKEGYNTYETDWLPVPPAQMDVNFSMQSTEKPTVTQIVAYPDGIEIQFNKYMCSEDMTAENINVTLEGIDIIKDIELMDNEKDYWTSEHGTGISGGSEEYFVSRIKVKPSITLMKGENINVSINKNVRTYAEVAMAENYENNLVVEKRPTGISVYDGNTESGRPPMAIEDKGYSLTCGTTQNIKVKITPTDSSIGKKLYLVTDNDWAVSLPNEVIIDNEGWATIPVEAVLPLDVNISMYLENSGLAKVIEISVVPE